MKTFLTLLFWSTFLSVTLWASPPVPFIGKVSIRQVNYSGDAQFTFSLHDGKGTILWTNGEKPRETIKVPVHNGRYHVLLGGQGMTSLPPSLFLKNEDLYLRVEFDNEDGNGLRHLKPDQLITATPRALVAEVAKVAKVSEKVTEAGITAAMLSPSLLADLNRTAGITEITREMLPQNVLDDLNRTIGVAQLSAEVNAKLNRDFTIQPGSISKSLLGGDVLGDLNRTIHLRDLAPEVIADLNDSIAPGSITLDMLASGVRADLNRTITKSMLSQEIKEDLNRTITRAMLPQDVREDLNRSIGVDQLSSEVAGVLKPVIFLSPVSIISVGGVGAKLAVEASGGNLSYQWKKNGLNLAGATSRVLTISDLNESQHEGNYTVVVSNIFGSATSSVAQIDVNGSTTDGLIAWWKFDETEGGIAYDSSGNGNDGNLTNAPTWSKGKIGGALSFDGTDDMVRTNLSGSYNEDFTWSAWIKTTDTQGGVLGVSGDTWQVGGASFYIYQGSPKVDVHSVGAKLGNLNLSSNTWTHYLLTVEDSGGTADPVRIFVNGLIEINSTLDWFKYNGQNYNLRIAHVPNHGEYYEGLIDDVRIYNRALSAFEVKSLYELGEQAVPSSGAGSTTVVNGTVADGSITTTQLSEQILKYLKPEITAQPQEPTVFADTNASLSVSAEGKYLTYQWKKNGTALAGETNATLTITDTNATQHDGTYTVVVSNDFGSVESGEADIEVWNVGDDVSNVMLWLDASNIGSFEISNTVIQNWRDLSANGNDMNISNGNPSLTEQLNGKTVAVYDGDDTTATTKNFSNDLDQSGYSIVALSRYAGNSRFRVISSGYSEGSRNWLLGHHDGKHSTFFAENWVDPGTTGDLNWHIFSVTHEPAISYNNGVAPLSSFWLNGTNRVQNSGLSSDTAPSPSDIVFGGALTTEKSTCEVAEFIMIAAEISDTKRQQVEGYLAHKWGLRPILANNHFYK